jgi:drug/metabolite transporter (DMT)-like permease
MKKAFFSLHLAVLLAGFTPILGKEIDLNEGVLVWFRLVFSAIIVGILFHQRNQIRKIPFSLILRISGIGFVLAMHWVLFYGSVKYSNASIAVVCISAAGFFSACIEPIILKRRINVWELLLGLLSIFGIYIIFDFHPHFQTGVIFGVLAALGSAIFPILNKKMLEKVTTQELTFYEFLTGGLVLTLILPVYLNLFPEGKIIPNVKDLGLLLILVIFCTIWSFKLQLGALKKISAFTVNLTYNLEPVYGVLLAFYLFNEHEMLSPHFYWGIGLIVLAIALQTWRTFYNKKVTKTQ